MKTKKLLVLFFLAVLIGVISISTALASNSSKENSSRERPRMFDGERPEFDRSRFHFKGELPEFDGERPEFDRSKFPFNGEMPELTEEQKAEMEAMAIKMQEQMRERLEKALADGQITQEQYDEILAAFENGELPKFGGMRGRRPMPDGERPEPDVGRPSFNKGARGEGEGMARPGGRRGNPGAAQPANI